MGTLRFLLQSQTKYSVILQFKNPFPTPFLEIPFTTLNDSGNYPFRKDKSYTLIFHEPKTQIRAGCAICYNQITQSINNKSQEGADV